MLSLILSLERLVVKVLMKQISLIYFRVYLEVYVIKNPICFSRWSVSTAIACENTNREWICIEKEAKYCDIGLERINKNRPELKKPSPIDLF